MFKVKYRHHNNVNDFKVAFLFALLWRDFIQCSVVSTDDFEYKLGPWVKYS